MTNKFLSFPAARLRAFFNGNFVPTRGGGMELSMKRSNGLVRFSIFIFLRLIIASILCLLFCLSIMTFINSPIGRFVCQTINLGILLSLVYSYCWLVGNKDHNKVLYDRCEEDVFKGLKAGIISTVPFLAVSILLILAKAGVGSEQMLYFYRMIASPFFPLHLSILPPTLTLSEIGWGSVIISSLSVLIYIITPAFAYYLGYREYHIQDILKYKKGEAKEAV